MDLIEQFKERLEEKTLEINASGLKDVNEELFMTLSKLIRDLNIKIISYQEHEGLITKESLQNDNATINALYDFYMREIGAQAIAKSQVVYVKEQLEAISSKLNPNNYEAVAQEFNEALALYSRILASVANSNLIKEIITNFRYQLFKYKLSDRVIDDRININSILGFIVKDIEQLLADNEVSQALKDELNKYVFNFDLIKDNIRTVLILLNLGLTNKLASKEEITQEFNLTYYSESEIEPEYHEPSKEVMSTVYSTAIEDLDKIYRYNLDEVKEGVPAVLIKHPISTIQANLGVIVDQLREKNYPYLKYLAESLICNDYMQIVLDLYSAIIFEDQDKSNFDFAVIAHKEEISPNHMARYISISGNEYLINYIIRTGNEAYFQEKALVDYAIRMRNIKLLEYMVDNNLWSIQNIHSLPTYLGIKLIKKHLQDKTEAEQQRLLISAFDEPDYELQTYILNELLKYNNPQLIIEALNILINKTTPNTTEFLKLLNDIKESPIKQEVIDHYYKYSSTSLTPEIKLIRKGFRLQQEKYMIYDYSSEIIEEMNIFEAAFISSFIGSENLVSFVSKFYQAKLDWPHILEVAKELNKEDYNQIKFYCYLSDKQTYFHNCITGIDFIKYMIAKLPESIIDFITRISPKDIASLDDAVLEIFATNYEEKLAEEGLTINDKLEQLQITSTHKQINEFLAYIMHRGLLNLEILSAYKSRLFIQENEKSKISIWADIMKRAIINMKDKYQKAGLVLRALDNHPYQKLSKEDIKTARNSSFCETDFDFNTIFLTEKDFSDIMNNETDSLERKQLKIRKYYGDLLRLIPLVPLSVQQRIIIQLAKSGIEEYIMYVKANYPEYLELILENLTDINLYQKLIAFDGTYSIDDALRVTLI